MSKTDLTKLDEKQQLNLIRNYVIQRGFHPDQKENIDANDLARRFKHDEYRDGKKRLKFFNNLLFKAVNAFGNLNGFQKKKITILRIQDNEGRMGKIQRKRY